MTIQQINSRLQEILINVGLSPSALTDQASFTRDLGLDSLDVTDLLLQVEINFGIRIPDEDWWMLQTVGQLKEYLSIELRFDTGQSLLSQEG
ncbi:acyl carrier protein [Spirosoma soli]|uniref:Acyl carrier protein n=1 Tax=Spirosoma soli TaxID=1770529 RepID=A0ABW5M6Q7_9BACT